MTDLKTAVQQALEALQRLRNRLAETHDYVARLDDGCVPKSLIKADHECIKAQEYITALRTALEAPENITPATRDKIREALEWISNNDPSPTQMESWIVEAMARARTTLGVLQAEPDVADDIADEIRALKSAAAERGGVE